VARKKTERFPLLMYKAIAKRWRWPAFLLIPAGLVLWWAIQRSSEGDLGARAWLAFLISGVGVLLFLYTLLANRACIRCQEDHFTVRTPLYPVVFSYRRVQSVRPVEFAKLRPPQKEKEARRRLYHRLWGKTSVVIDLQGYPLPEWWLRLWFNAYLFHPKTTGLVVLTEDWMGLIRQIEMRRTQLKRDRRRA
jgi:hypothetical protein